MLGALYKWYVAEVNRLTAETEAMVRACYENSTPMLEVSLWEVVLWVIALPLVVMEYFVSPDTTRVEDFIEGHV